MTAVGRKPVARTTPQIDPVDRRTADTSVAEVPVRCRDCGRPHGVLLRCLPDGRWFDPHDQTWRDHRGRRAEWPDVVEYSQVRDQGVAIRTFRTSGDDESRARSLCPRCHLLRESKRNAARSRLKALRRRAMGDLFLGAYDQPGMLDRVLKMLGGRKTRPKS